MNEPTYSDLLLMTADDQAIREMIRELTAPYEIYDLISNFPEISI